MFKWLATKFETGRASLQSRLEDSLQVPVVPTPQVDAAEWRNRGNAFLSAGSLVEAAECYRCGIRVAPNDAVCYSNLGFVLGELGRSSESQDMLLKAVVLNPTDFDAHYLLGNLARSRGELMKALTEYRKALNINPTFDLCRRDLCVVLAQTGQTREARTVLEQGPASTTNTVDYYYFSGTLHLAEDEPDDAVTEFRKAMQLQPQNASILINLGIAQLRLRDVFSAIETYRTLLEFEPANVLAHANIAAGFQLSGQIELAIQSYRHALELDPDHLSAHQNLLYALTYVPNFSSTEYLIQAQKYSEKISHKANAYSQWLCTVPTQIPRPLRIGFVSGDLRNHPVGMFLESVLASINPNKLTLIAYSNSPTEDSTSARLKKLFSEWHLISRMDDETLAKKIHDDRIDILVDLSGHTELNRLSVFPWRPAPVQVSWLGYWASTGVKEIDYILVDQLSVPESDEILFSEKLWYLPDTRLCFTPPVTAYPINIGLLPAQRNGYITFGSFQLLSKMNECTFRVWSQVLKRIPTARLRLQSWPLAFPHAIAETSRKLVDANIDVDRVEFCGGMSRDAYLMSYSDVDVVLDTFPFPGGTTTAEALWMGVPTVTLAGNSLLARQGASMMGCVGLDDWVAANETEYVDIAVNQVSNLEKLAELRSSLRCRALASPVFNADKFARNLEQAFIEIGQTKF